VTRSARPAWRHTLFGHAFRPFFLLGAAFAAAAMALWIGLLDGYAPARLALSPAWHGHEMLFGFVGAAIAGFVLTAVANWTGRPPVRGATLGALVSCWLAGRVAMLFSERWPAWWVAGLDLLFPVLLCALVGREVLGARSRRNYPIAAITGMIALLDLLHHLAAAGVLGGGERRVLSLMVHLVLVLITIVAGRIVPAFTRNWLAARGETRLPRRLPWLERSIVPLTALTGVAASASPTGGATGVLALLCGLAHGLRLGHWRGAATRAEPIVWVLHAAYLWLPLGYLLTALAAMGLVLPPVGAQHALTVGAIGGMILAVTTRVGLGHTGRPLRAAQPIVLAYLVLGLAALLRILAPVFDATGTTLLTLSAAGWIFAFGCFVGVYGPVLTQPRSEGGTVPARRSDRP